MTAPAFSIVRGELVADDPAAEAAQLEARAAKLMQRARDIRHTLNLNAIEAARVKVPRCMECDADEDTCHFGWCSCFGDGAGEIVR